MTEKKKDLTGEIAEIAGTPKSYETDGEKMTTHSLPDLIAADQHLQRKRASRNPFGCIRRAKITTEGGR